MILLSPEAYHKLRGENDWELSHYEKQIAKANNNEIQDAETRYARDYLLPSFYKKLRIANEIHDMLNKIEKWNEDYAEQIRESNLHNENKD